MIGRYYKTAETCPLSVFVRVMVSNDLTHLKTFGYVKKQALAEAWELIFDQYLQIANGQKYVLLLRRLKDVAIMRNKTVLASRLIDVLEMKYNEKLVASLKLIGFRQKFDPRDVKGYFNDISKAKKQVKNDLFTLEEMEKEAKKEESGEVKESDFDQILTELSRFQGYRLDKNVITVSEYVNILNNYREVNKPKNGKQRKD